MRGIGIGIGAEGEPEERRGDRGAERKVEEGLRGVEERSSGEEERRGEEGVNGF